MNVNEMGSRILQVYKDLDGWPEMKMPEHLMELVSEINDANRSYQVMRKYGLGLIHGTCCISAADCDYSAVCDVPKGDREAYCQPQGLAFRLADILMYTMAVMTELGIDVDAVVTAEYKYLAHQAEEVEG